MSESQKLGTLVTVKHAALVLGMAPSSLYRLCQCGRVPSYAVGAKGYGVRVDIEEAKTALRRPAKAEEQTS
jgi:precorrin isomerase